MGFGFVTSKGANFVAHRKSYDALSTVESHEVFSNPQPPRGADGKGFVFAVIEEEVLLDVVDLHRVSATEVCVRVFVDGWGLHGSRGGESILLLIIVNSQFCVDGKVWDFSLDIALDTELIEDVQT